MYLKYWYVIDLYNVDVGKCMIYFGQQFVVEWNFEDHRTFVR